MGSGQIASRGLEVQEKRSGVRKDLDIDLEASVRSSRGLWNKGGKQVDEQKGELRKGFRRLNSSSSNNYP